MPKARKPGATSSNCRRNMESLIFAINAVMPIALMVSLGYLLKKLGMMPPEFSKKANAIVFRVCLPAMLFLNVYKMEDFGDVSFGYIVYAVAVVAFIFAVNIPLVMKVTKNGGSRGALLQASFRSNFALIGIPLAQSLYGQEGVAVSALLSAVTIPIFNILAVVSLSIFSKDGKKKGVGEVLAEIGKNPLILGVIAGCIALGIRALFVKAGISFRLSDVTPVYKMLSYLSDIATPMSLLVLGAQFEFSAVSSLKKEIIYGTATRVGLVPVLGLGLAYLFFKDSFTGAHFASLVALFATPVAVSSVPMAQEMNSNATLAGQLVVFTTVFSSLSVGLASFLLKSVGVFG